MIEAPHQPISQRELADLSSEAGWQISTELEALEYRKVRDARRHFEDRMIDEPRILELQHQAGVNESGDGGDE